MGVPRWLVCLGLCSALAQAERLPWPEAVESFMTDPQVVAARFGGVGYGPPATGPKLRGYALGSGYSQGRVTLNEDTGRVVGYEAPGLASALPERLLERDEAERPAREFAARWVPEVLEAGADLTVTVGELPAPDCTWRVRFERRRRGFLLPTGAEVGVRVSDSKITYFAARAQAVTLPEKLPVTREQALATGLATMSPGAYALPATALPVADAIVTEAKGLWRPAWVVAAEAKLTSASALGAWSCNRWTVDAETGEVLRRDIFNPAGSDERVWYEGHGGKRAAGAPPRMPYADNVPLASPDGQRLLFISSRPRPGYPAWRKPSPGLFVVSVNGDDLRCLVATPVKQATWSPDGRQIAYIDDSGLCVLDLATMASRLLLSPSGAAAAQLDPMRNPVWLADGRIGIYYRPPRQTGGELRAVDPNQPAPVPPELVSLPAGIGAYVSMSVDGQGRLLVLCSQPSASRNLTNCFSLWAFDLREPDHVPTALIPRLTATALPARMGLRSVVTSMDAPPQVIDLKANDARPWSVPWLPSVAGAPRQLAPGPACFLPDDKTAVAVGLGFPGPGQPGMIVLWKVAADGVDAVMLTRPSAELVPMAQGGN